VSNVVCYMQGMYPYNHLHLFGFCYSVIQWNLGALIVSRNLSCDNWSQMAPPYITNICHCKTWFSVCNPNRKLLRSQEKIKKQTFYIFLLQMSNCQFFPPLFKPIWEEQAEHMFHAQLFPLSSARCVFLSWTTEFMELSVKIFVQF
jgi:hypothetical protein